MLSLIATVVIVPDITDEKTVKVCIIITPTLHIRK